MCKFVSLIFWFEIVNFPLKTVALSLKNDGGYVWDLWSGTDGKNATVFRVSSFQIKVVLWDSKGVDEYKLWQLSIEVVGGYFETDQYVVECLWI